MQIWNRQAAVHLPAVLAEPRSSGGHCIRCTTQQHAVEQLYECLDGGMCRGTLLYMPPEQKQNIVTYTTDIWSWACCVIEALHPGRLETAWYDLKVPEVRPLNSQGEVGRKATMLAVY